MTGTFDLLLAAESLIPPRTGIGNYTWNLYRELLLRPEIGRVVLMAGLRQIDQVPDQAANAAMADATSSPASSLRRLAHEFGAGHGRLECALSLAPASGAQGAGTNGFHSGAA